MHHLSRCWNCLYATPNCARICAIDVVHSNALIIKLKTSIYNAASSYLSACCTQ